MLSKQRDERAVRLDDATLLSDDGVKVGLEPMKRADSGVGEKDKRRRVKASAEREDLRHDAARHAARRHLRQKVAHQRAERVHANPVAAIDQRRAFEWLAHKRTQERIVKVTLQGGLN